MSYALSVIIPAYNVERCLQRCLDSVYRDYDERVQVVVVNDGSTDHTQEIIDGNTSRAGFVGVASDNRGEGGARNLAMQYAEGEYIWCVDADDEVAVGSVPFLLNELEMSARDYDMIVFGIEVRKPGTIEYGEYNTRVEINTLDKMKASFDDIFTTINYNSCCNKLLKLDTIREQGITFRKYKSGADAAFVTSYLPYVNSILVLNGTPYIYHLDESGNSRRSTYEIESIVQENLSRLDEQCAVFRELDLSCERVLEEAYSRVAFGAMNLIFQQQGLSGGLYRFRNAVNSQRGIRDATLRLTGCRVSKRVAAIRFLACHPTAAYAYFKKRAWQTERQ